MHAEESQSPAVGMSRVMVMLTFLLLLAGFICFLVAAASVSIGRVNLIALGLAFWIFTALLNAGIPGAA